MFDTTRVPVTVYRWDDPGAPQVKPAAGAFKTVLKACLHTGYGERDTRKEPLGWDILFEEDYKACFKSRHLQAPDWVLGVDDSVFERNSKHCFEARLLQKPTSATAGAIVRENQYRNVVYMGSTFYDVPLRWVLIGHQRGFILTTVNSNIGSYPMFLMFGSFKSLAAADPSNCLMVSMSSNYGYQNSSTYQEVRAAAGYGGDNAEITAFAKSSSVQKTPYPNPITNGFTADDMYIYEKIADGWALRGLLPGVMEIMEKMPSETVVPFGTVYDNLDGTGDKYMYIRHFNDLGRLINLTAWEL